MNPTISQTLTTFLTSITDNALPTVALVLGILVVPAIGVAAVKMVYRKAQAIVS